MRMRNSFNRFMWTMAGVGALALVVLASAAEAQNQGGRGRGRGGPGGGFGRGGGMGGPNFEIMLLNAQPVQKELELVDDQVQSIKKYGEEQQAAGRERMEKLRDLPDDERREKMQELMKEGETRATAKLDEVLLPHQRDRLKELSIQVRGPQAIASEDIAGKLGLTSEQKEQIEKLGEDNRAKMRELFQGGGGGDNREKIQQMRKENGEKLLGVLTAEQKQQYEKMQGKKADIDMGQIFNGRGPGGPGGGGAGGGGGGRRRGGGGGGNNST